MPALISFLPALTAVLLMSHAAGSSPAAVDIVAKEFSLAPRSAVAQSGDVELVVVNRGEIEHNLVVEAPGGRKLAQVDVLEPGETGRIEVSLPAGIYRLYCGLPGHRDAGMVATLRVNP